MGRVYDLADDITLQILLHVPLDSLLACKCVSKQWRNLIHSPVFFNLYRNHKPPFLFYSRKALSCIFMPDGDEDNQIITPRRFPASPPNSQTRININDDHYVNAPYDYMFPDSTGKMLCVKEAWVPNFHVYNLLTGASIRVPFPEGYSSIRQWSRNRYGFGYNAAEDDYNIVGLMRTPGHPSYCDSIRVYSLKNRAWKSFPGFPDAPYNWYFMSYIPYCINGSLHWVVQHTMVDCVVGYKVIVALDLHTLRLTEIKMPGAPECHSANPMLSGLDGQLCCCYYMYGTAAGTYFEVWVMSTTMPSCWSKLLCIRGTLFGEMAGIGDFMYDKFCSPSVYRFGGKLAVCVAHESKVRVFKCDPLPQGASARRLVLYKTSWIEEEIPVSLSWNWSWIEPVAHCFINAGLRYLFS